ncbi:hypothetical protein FACS1894188_11570 [Clostridia bacterium]|nr:hypothetical protein FACS1894188_11570 [Clostridia bacterium]
MDIVVKRFIDSGLSVDETAVRMDVPIDYVKAVVLKGQNANEIIS